MRLVTGTRLSYIPEVFTEGLLPLDRQEGVIACQPAFETESFNLPVLLGNHELLLNCGILPEGVRQSLGLHPNEGILGASFFETVPSTLAFPDGELVVLV